MIDEPRFDPELWDVDAEIAALDAELRAQGHHPKWSGRGSGLVGRRFISPLERWRR